VSWDVLRVAWYRCRTTYRRRLGGYLSIVLLLGLVGGLAMGSVAAARRTQSSFPAYLASTNPSALFGVTAVLDPLIGSHRGYDPVILRKISRLPHVQRVSSESGLDVIQLTRDGTPINNVFPPAAGNGLGSDNGEDFDQDRVTIVQGKMADPRRADQMVMDASIAAVAHLHVGERVRVGVYTNAQTLLPGFGTAKVRPYRVEEVTLTGLAIEPHNVVEDDIDSTASWGLFTPAFTRQFLACCSNYTATGVQVDTPGDAGPVQNEMQRLFPKGFPEAVLASSITAKAERAIKPESIALGVFGVIAALAALLICGQIIGRQTRLGVNDLGTMRALGASPAMTSVDGLIGILGAVVSGAVLAVIVAFVLSPLAPLGPVRPVDPTPGLSADWAVFGAGVLLFVLVLGGVAAVQAYRAEPRRAAARRAHVVGSPPGVATATASLSPPAVLGVRFALEPGADRSTAPVRSAIFGAMLAVTVLVSTVTFGASLDTLVSHPALYGWNWSNMLSSGGDIPAGPATRLLDADRDVQAWSGAYYGYLQFNGLSVPVLGEAPGARVQPPVLSGHALQTPDEVVLGASTLSQLHAHVGDEVTVTGPPGGPRVLTIAGTASMPTIGMGGVPHMEMGTGALLAYRLIPAASRNPFANPVTGPESVFVDLRPGVDAQRARQRLQGIASTLTNNFNFGVTVVNVLHPAEIVNYRSMGTTPAILGAALAAGAVVALALTLLASVRRRRHDLALLKTLGFTGRQLHSIVSWQSMVSVGLGALFGVPLGIIVGRALWTVFADEIHAVPQPTVPALTVTLIALGALVLAWAVAAVPGRLAARTPTALLLRAE